MCECGQAPWVASSLTWESVLAAFFLTGGPCEAPRSGLQSLSPPCPVNAKHNDDDGQKRSFACGPGFSGAGRRHSPLQQCSVHPAMGWKNRLWRKRASLCQVLTRFQLSFSSSGACRSGAGINFVRVNSPKPGSSDGPKQYPHLWLRPPSAGGSLLKVAGAGAFLFSSLWIPSPALGSAS